MAQRRWNRAVRAALAIFCLAWLEACGGMLHVQGIAVDVPRGYRYAARDHARLERAAPVQRTATPLVVDVVSPVRLATGNARGAADHFEQIDLPDAAGGPALQATLDAMHTQTGLGLVIFWAGYGRVFRDALAFHLGRRFSAATVALSPNPTAANVVVVPRLSFTNGLTRDAIIQAQVSIAGQAPFVVVGHARRASWGHLFWAIPVMLSAGAVLGVAIVSPILSSIAQDHVRETTALAIEDVARQLAEQLAARLGAGPAVATR